MKNGLVMLAILSLWAGRTRAQTDPISPIDTQPSEIGTTLTEPDDPQSPSRNLPDAPIPVLPSRQDGPMPCPAGIGKPCALLGGRVYFSDRSHMTEHDKTWFGALKNPLMIAGIAVNLGADLWDYKATRACMAAHTCIEGNPLMGQSRAQQLGVGLSLDALLYYLTVRLKKDGDGNAAFGLLAVSTTLHLYFGAHAQSLAK